MNTTKDTAPADASTEEQTWVSFGIHVDLTVRWYPNIETIALQDPECGLSIHLASPAQARRIAAELIATADEAEAGAR